MRAHSGSGLLVGGALIGAAAAPRPPGIHVAQRLRRWWRTQQAARLEDEILDARTPGLATPSRLVVPLLTPVLLVAGALFLREPDNRVALMCLVCGVIAIGYGLVSEVVERRVEQLFWVQLANALVYAAIISAILATALLVDHPRPHSHWILFFLYFLLIGGTGLTNDPRQSICAGAFSIVGYLAVVPILEYAASSGSSAMAVRLAPEFEWVANSAKVSLLAAATVMASASAWRGRALRRMSLRDGLTGLLNRHAFDQCLERIALRARRRKTPMSIAMLDIDHFKDLNDAHGHAVGDAVLRWVSSWLLERFRSTDVVARYGGEEFVVAFLDTADERLADRLEALRRGIEATTLRTPGSDRDIHVTLSMGIASLPVNGGSVTEVLACADARLYEAKRAGRNRIVADLRPAPD